MNALSHIDASCPSRWDRRAFVRQTVTSQRRAGALSDQAESLIVGGTAAARKRRQRGARICLSRRWKIPFEQLDGTVNILPMGRMGLLAAHQRPQRSARSSARRASALSNSYAAAPSTALPLPKGNADRPHTGHVAEFRRPSQFLFHPGRATAAAPKKVQVSRSMTIASCRTLCAAAWGRAHSYASAGTPTSGRGRADQHYARLDGDVRVRRTRKSVADLQIPTVLIAYRIGHELHSQFNTGRPCWPLLSSHAGTLLNLPRRQSG